MLEYNDITGGKFIVYEGDPYEVLEHRVFRMQQRKPVNQVKMRNLMTGSIKEVTFHVSDKVKEAEIETREIKYLYNRRGEWWFAEANDPSKRFSLKETIVGERGKFLKDNAIIEAVTFAGRLVGLKFPIKVELKVVEAPPAVKGDTAKGGSKQVKLETGVSINAPIFVNEGDVVRINTETGEYVERAN